MRCHVFAARAGRTPQDVSWNVMICMRRAHILWSVRAWAPGIPSGFSGSSSLAWACPFGPSSFRSSRRPARRRRDPDSRVSCARLCRRGRAFRAGAVRTPDCARETQGARLPCVSQGFFRAGAQQERGRLRGRLSCPAAPYRLPALQRQSTLENYFCSKEQMFSGKRARAYREGRRSIAPCGRSPSAGAGEAGSRRAARSRV